MKTPFRGTFLGLMLLLLATAGGHAWGCHAALSPDAQLGSDLIVAGKLRNRKVVNEEYATADLTVQRVLKGDAATKQVVMKMRAKVTHTASWTYAGDEEGLWFLRRVETAGAPMYETFHPMCFENFAGLDDAKRKATLDGWAARVKPSLFLDVDLAGALKAVEAKEYEGRIFRIRATLIKNIQKVRVEDGGCETVETWGLSDGDRLRCDVEVDFDLQKANLAQHENKQGVATVVWRAEGPSPRIVAHLGSFTPEGVVISGKLQPKPEAFPQASAAPPPKIVCPQATVTTSDPVPQSAQAEGSSAEQAKGR